MDARPSDLAARSGARLLRFLDEAGLGVRACYWRLLRPTRRRWALVVSLAEFGPGLEPGLTRLLELCAERREDLPGVAPLDLWALERDHVEPRRYARAVRDRGGGWPRHFAGDGGLPPALLYRLPAP